MKRLIYTLLSLFISISLVAQPKPQPDGAEILHKIQKLKVLGTVLYVAAHPDDENTRLIAWLANEKKYRTGYLSMTRGDGGQNLIGPEIREKLGIIRTQELLAARRVDKGEQFFTRANDFGYSKSPDETFDVWNEDKILSDVVWVFRKFKPDVIVTRFPTTGEGGHGHHTASAILAQKAFELAADPNAYPEQLKYVDTWQPKRLYLNTGRWWNPNISADKQGVLEVNIGEYNPLLGTSYSEMAAISRSQHKSQGFGSTGSRGERNEYLEHKLGDPVNELLEDVQTSWERVGKANIQNKINSIISSYNPVNPSGSLESLLELRKEITSVENDHWKEIKLNEVDDIIKDITGLYMEATTANPYLVRDEPIKINVELANRANADIQITKIEFPEGANLDSTFVLPDNQVKEVASTITLPGDFQNSTPYWLREIPEKGYYQVNDRRLIGKPENDPALAVKIKALVEGQEITYSIPVEYKRNDPVMGEVRRPVAVVPALSMEPGEEVYLFPDNEAKTVKVKLKNYGSSFQGNISLEVPNNWTIAPKSIAVTLSNQLDEEEIEFNVKPPKGQASVKAVLKATANGKTWSSEVDEIDYEHIPTQTLISEADAEFIKLDVKINGNNIGYIEGAGDNVPSTLRELGYNVTMLSEEAISAGLDQYDAIILGIRILNTNDRIGYIMDELLSYAENGGVLVLQYNTSYRMNTETFAPYPLELSRDRVTVEEAPVKILDPDHPVMTYPNKITSADFDNWVQERGLYFPGKWDDRYTPILGISDPGESETRGSLLVAPYGEGYYVYTGISWFRQLPAGVPGAIRIFANILSLGSSNGKAK